MSVFAWVIAAILLVLVVWFGVVRAVRKLRPVPMPARCAWMVQNPLRRLVCSASGTLDWVGIREGAIVLELGPGPGFLTVKAAKRMGSSGRLCCVDISRNMISMLKDRVRRSGVDVDLVVGDAIALPLSDATFDHAFLVYVLGEIPDRQAAFAELRRVLKPGAVLSISEVLVDPDYCLKSTVIAEGRRAGFEPFQEFGNFFVYAVNLRIPD